MIGIIAAMEIEMNTLRSYIENPEEQTISGIRFVRGRIGKNEIVTAVCGIGKVFAAVCAQTMILTYHPDCIINTGVAGTLTDKLDICSIAVSDSVVQHDMDTTPIGDPYGLISGLNIIHVPADKTLAEALTACACKLGFKTCAGPIASGDQFISGGARKDWIVNQFGAIACEMEGAAIGTVCHVNGVPFCVLRAISDGANNDSHMDYPQFAKLAAENSVKLLMEYLA